MYKNQRNPSTNCCTSTILKKGTLSSSDLTTFLVLKCSDTIFIILVPLTVNLTCYLLPPLYSFYLLLYLFWIPPTTRFTDSFNFRYTQVDGQDNLSISCDCAKFEVVYSTICFSMGAFSRSPAPWSVFPLTSAPMAILTCFLHNKNLCRDILHYDTT